MGKRENAGYQHFLLFPLFFTLWILPQGCLKSLLCGKRYKNFNKLMTVNSIKFRRIMLNLNLHERQSLPTKKNLIDEVKNVIKRSGKKNH